MSSVTIALLAAFNVLVIFLLIAAPIGRRRVSAVTTIAAGRSRVWNAVWPLGPDALWSGEFLAVERLDGPLRVRVKLRWNDRAGKPIERILRFEEMTEGACFASVVEDDSSLDQEFWSDFREEAFLDGVDGAIRVTLSQTDRYRGVAFLVFRYFAMRRQLTRLKSWSETGAFQQRGLFERPTTQAGFAVLSAFILWPFFGLTVSGLILASVLTTVVALHELGHMLAFRVSGHTSARMIFIPLLGGIAIGGRPYDSRFEVAFVALMGAGFSAFLVPVAIASSAVALSAGLGGVSVVLAMLAGCLALFNIANLVPVWKFDGGQVLRQIFPDGPILAGASCAALGAFMAVGYRVGFSAEVLVASGVVFAILSLITTGSGAKLKGELKAILPGERVLLGFGFVSVFAVHGHGVVWAAERLI